MLVNIAENPAAQGIRDVDKPVENVYNSENNFSAFGKAKRFADWVVVNLSRPDINGRERPKGRDF